MPTHAPRQRRAWSVCTPAGQLLHHAAPSRVRQNNAQAASTFARKRAPEAARAAFNAFAKTEDGARVLHAKAGSDAGVGADARDAHAAQGAWIAAQRDAHAHADADLDAFASAADASFNAYAHVLYVCVVDAQAARPRVHHYAVSYFPHAAPSRREVKWKVVRHTRARKLKADAPRPAVALHDFWRPLGAQVRA